MNEDFKKQKKEIFHEYKNEKKILKIGKWKAMMKNAFTIICIFLLFSMVSNIITSLFYTSGEPTKLEIYNDVIESTIAITKPNIRINASSTNTGGFFKAIIKGNLVKRVGREDIKVGETDFDFFLGKLKDRGLKFWLNEPNRVLFLHPNESEDIVMYNDWKKLEKLPEGTVAEVYLSFDKLYETDDILKKFIDREVDPLWLAVDTGYDKKRRIIEHIGFPYRPIWHSDDWTLESRKEEKDGLFLKSVTEGKSAPTVENYGSGNIRNENFIKTLKLVKKYESIAEEIDPFKIYNMQRRIDYINKNGVKIYGMVITGPTKEILKLKKEEWVKVINIGEVRLWNW